MNSSISAHFQDKELYLRLQDKSKSEETTPFFSLAILTEAPLDLLNSYWSIGIIKDKMSVLEFGEALFYILREMEGLL